MEACYFDEMLNSNSPLKRLIIVKEKQSFLKVLKKVGEK